MTLQFYTNASDSYALALGLNDQKVPVCLVLSVDSVSVGGESIITSEHYVLEGDDLHVSGPDGVVVLKEIEQACLDAVGAKLPLVVIDPKNQREVMVVHFEDPASHKGREPLQ